MRIRKSPQPWANSDPSARPRSKRLWHGKAREILPQMNTDNTGGKDPMIEMLEYLAVKSARRLRS
jgi:hypothetical protein